MSYLKYSLQAQVLTSNDIDQAVASGVDLSEVTLNDTELVSDIIKTNEPTEPATTYQRMVRYKFQHSVEIKGFFSISDST